MKKIAVCLTAAALSLSAGFAKAASESCDDPLKSKLGQSFCVEAFKDLAPGLYNVSFQYMAEKITGNSDRNLRLGFLFDSQGGGATWGVKRDTTATAGWNTYSFITQAGGNSAIAFTLLGLYPKRFDMALQNIQVTSVPEPATSALLLAGLGAVVFVARRRKQVR